MSLNIALNARCEGIIRRNVKRSLIGALTNNIHDRPMTKFKSVRSHVSLKFKIRSTEPLEYFQVGKWWEILVTEKWQR